MTGALLPSPDGDEGDSEPTQDLDEDSDADQLVEDGEHLQPAVLQYEIRVRHTRRREPRDGEVERVDDVPVLAERVRERADDDQQHAGAEDRAELLLAEGAAERGEHAPKHHQRGGHPYSFATAVAGPLPSVIDARVKRLNKRGRLSLVCGRPSPLFPQHSVPWRTQSSSLRRSRRRSRHRLSAAAGLCH